MIICLCEGVSDRTIRTVIRKGCRSMRDLREATGAARNCGQCACDLKRMLREEAACGCAQAGGTPVTPALGS